MKAVIKRKEGNLVRFDEVAVTLEAQSAAEKKELRKLIPLISGRSCRVGTVLSDGPYTTGHILKVELLLQK